VLVPTDPVRVVHCVTCSGRRCRSVARVAAAVILGRVGIELSKDWLARVQLEVPHRQRRGRQRKHGCQHEWRRRWRCPFYDKVHTWRCHRRVQRHGLEYRGQLYSTRSASYVWWCEDLDRVTIIAIIADLVGQDLPDEGARARSLDVEYACVCTRSRDCVPMLWGALDGTLCGLTQKARADTVSASLI
jgi:hypothetical protein